MQSPRIQVIIRKRPLNEKETANGQTDIISVRSSTSIAIREPKIKLDLTKYIDEHVFNFDAALGETVSNMDIYQYYVRPILRHAFEGNKATIFAFGQTGSGKTYTMNGYPRKHIQGLYEYASHDIFDALKHPLFKNHRVSCTFYQLYCEKIYDLLNERTQLKIGQDRKKVIHVTGGVMARLNSPADLLGCIKSGMDLRKTSKNGTNLQSSRSHAVLQISIFQQNKPFGQISFIDLAGCERGADTIDQGKQTKIDGAEINKSLLALKQCIRAMDNNSKHIPFRGSKLTMILRDSFGDNCKTLMIGNISPGSGSCENTLNTLRYSDTVKELKQSKQPLSKQDLKAKQLMLPRSQKNKISIAPMEEQVTGPSHRFSLKNPPLRNIDFQQNNRNLRNTFTDAKKKHPPKQKLDAPSLFSVRKIQTSSIGPLSAFDLEDWDDSIELIRNWQIQNQPLEPYQQLISNIRNYLQRQLKDYLSLCQECYEVETKLNEQNIELLRYVYSNQHQSNKDLYEKSTALSTINQQKADLLAKQHIQLQSYMAHLERQEECERKLKQAIDIQETNKSNDDEMSMIDEIQSQWSDELFSYEQPPINRVVTRQSMHLQKEHMPYNTNILRSSFDYKF